MKERRYGMMMCLMVGTKSCDDGSYISSCPLGATHSVAFLSPPTMSPPSPPSSVSVPSYVVELSRYVLIPLYIPICLPVFPIPVHIQLPRQLGRLVSSGTWGAWLIRYVRQLLFSLLFLTSLSPYPGLLYSVHVWCIYQTITLFPLLPPPSPPSLCLLALPT